MREKTIAACARISGFLLLGSSVLHVTLGMSEVLMAIKTGEVRADIAGTFVSVWIFSTVMLVLSGIWVLFLAPELKQLKRRAWWQGIFIGLGYTGGAAVAIAVTQVQAHLIFYGVVGLLLLLPLLRWAGSFRSGAAVSTGTVRKSTQPGTAGTRPAPSSFDSDQAR